MSANVKEECQEVRAVLVSLFCRLLLVGKERFKYVLRELCIARQAVYLPAYRASCLAQSSRLHCDLIPLVE